MNLPSAGDETNPLILVHPDGQANEDRPASSRARSWIGIVILSITIAIMFDIADYLILAPRVRLYESITCTRYYRVFDPSLIDHDGTVPEKFCKINSVQDKVAMIFGWQVCFDSLQGILLPIPYGWLADRYGRKWIIVLAFTSYVMSILWILFTTSVLDLPLQFVWISSAFFIIGGGPSCAASLINTIVADVAPPEKRSSMFLYRFASDLVAECLVPPVTSLLMGKGPFVPLITAVAFQIIGLMLALALPETLPKKVPLSDIDDTISAQTPEVASDDELSSGIMKSKRNRVLHFLQAESLWHLLTHDRAIIALLLTFFVAKVGRQSINLLLQYVSTRYHWSISKAGILYSLRAGVNLTLYLVILPLLSTSRPFRAMNAALKDLTIARGSIVLMILGTLSLSISGTPMLMLIGLIIYTLGTGFAPVVRSLITSLVESHETSSNSDIGRLYAVIAAIEGIGNLVAGPGMAFAFRIGLNSGKGWLGLPFLVATILFIPTGLAVFMIHPRDIIK